MAIIKMSKISIIGLNDDKDAILKLLMKQGVAQIDNAGELADDEEFSSILERDDAQSEVLAAEQKLFALSQAIDAVKSAAAVKSPMFSPKPLFKPIDDDGFEQALKQAESINEKAKEISSQKSYKNVLINNADALKPWQKLDAPLDKLETKLTTAVLGTMPANVDKAAMSSALENAAAESVFEIIDADKQLAYAFMIAHKSCFDNALDALRGFGFAPVTFQGESGTPAEAIREYEKKATQAQQKIDALNGEIASSANILSSLENAYDYCVTKRDEAQIRENIVNTRSAFYIKGYAPTKKASGLVSKLTQSFNCYAETEDVANGEEFPILLENSSFVTPFESITNMYSTPSHKDIDPSAIMTIFYIIFFGMMLADAGYGLLLAIACAVIVKKAKMGKGEGNIIKLMCICGVSTAVWGFIFGSCFGVAFPKNPLINPLEDVMLLMGMSLVFGLIHIYIGLGVKAYMLLRDKDVLGFIGDVLVWYIFIAGVVLLVLPIVAGDIGALADWGKYLGIIGAVGIILTNGRAQKNPIMKLYKGVSALYGITGYFGDVLSYTRLMALCLSSGVIAQVINLLGDMTGPIGFIFVALIGHSINLFIGALGAYVHTSRLQFVEFFGKFYEGGGIPFSPFKFKPKYTDMSKEEM